MATDNLTATGTATSAGIAQLNIVRHLQATGTATSAGVAVQPLVIQTTGPITTIPFYDPS